MKFRCALVKNLTKPLVHAAVLVGLSLINFGHAATVSLNPSLVAATQGSQFSVDVIVGGLTGSELVGGFDLDVVFNASVLNANSVAFGSALGVDGVDQFSNAVISAGRIDFAAVSLLSGTDLMVLQGGPFVIARLLFDATGLGSTTLGFDLLTAPGLLFSDEFGNALSMSVGSEAFVQVTNGGSAVPEPGSLALTLLGLLGFVALRRIRHAPR